MGGYDYDGLRKLKELGVKRASFDMHHIREVEFFESKPEPQAQTIPMADLMPPDDVMLFAATEDPEEVMKARKE